MSTLTLSNAEIKILDKGLKFAPPCGLNKFQTYMDIHKYVRKVNIKRYLLSNPFKGNRATVDGVRHSNVWNASLFNPPGGLALSVCVSGCGAKGLDTRYKLRCRRIWSWDLISYVLIRIWLSAPLIRRAGLSYWTKGIMLQKYNVY